MTIATSRDYIVSEIERIKREQWCLGEKYHRPVSFEEAREHFTSDIYDGLTPEDWFHIDSLREINQQIAENKIPLDNPLILDLIRESSPAIEKLWSNLDNREVQKVA